MNIPFKLGYQCADSLLPIINGNARLLHILKGYALTYRMYEISRMYTVNGRLESSN